MHTNKEASTKPIEEYNLWHAQQSMQLFVEWRSEGEWPVNIVNGTGTEGDDSPRVVWHHDNTTMQATDEQGGFYVVECSLLAIPVVQLLTFWVYINANVAWTALPKGCLVLTDKQVNDAHKKTTSGHRHNELRLHKDNYQFENVVTIRNWRTLIVIIITDATYSHLVRLHATAQWKNWAQFSKDK